MNFESHLSDEAQSALKHLRKMAGESGKLRTSTCIPKLASALGLPRITIDEAIRDLYRAGFLTYQADARELPITGYLSVALESTIPDALELAWQHALEASGIGHAAKDLTGLFPALQGLSPEDLATLAHCLKRLTKAGSGALEDAGFNVSARHIMGGSKVLSRMSGRMLEAIGLPSRLHNSSPRYVVCAGPPDPVATLLIENPRAFENAVRSGLAESAALICTFGFALSYLGQEGVLATDTAEIGRAHV